MEKSIKITVEVPNEKKIVNPSPGSFIRLEGRIYKAIATDQYSCAGCCFFQEKTRSIGCHIPVSVNCDKKVFKDVTDDIADMEIELIDDPAGKNSTWPLVLFCLAFWTTVIILLIN